MALTNSEMEKGVDRVMEDARLKKHAKDADLVLTGEGVFDSQAQ